MHAEKVGIGLGAAPTAFNVLVQTRLGPMLVNRNDAYVGQSLIRYGEFSEGEAALFRQLVGAGDVVIEAGANIGAHTLELAQLVGEQGLIFAYEPQRLVFQTLCANLALNQCTQVVARQAGLGAAPGVMSITAVDPRCGNNFGGISLQASGQGEQVPIETIDQLALPRCRLIKADVEGMEADVLAGARSTILRCRPLLFLENDRPEKSATLIQAVLGLGYRLWWHITPLFNAHNFNQDPSNVFGKIVSYNMLAQPVEASLPVAGMQEVLSPDAAPPPFSF